ncbi:hypothetical protein HanPI659440_Chr02g0041701 [Helianthus annuus]|nr:hypothetical protein HanPI659440_Chr02g0041701 [Helianthus annuus]
MSSNREWMYGTRTNKDGTINLQFQQRVDYFLDFAYKNAKNIEGECNPRQNPTRFKFWILILETRELRKIINNLSRL